MARAEPLFDTWRDSTIAFIMSDFKVFHKPPPSPPHSLTMSLLCCGERLALQAARCGATITTSCWEWDLTRETTVHIHTRTHTLTHSLTHDATHTIRQGCFMHAEALQHNVYCWSRECEQKDRRSSKTTFLSHLRSWVFIPLVCTEIYKTLTPANPAATKTGRGQKGTGRYSQNTPTEQATKL